MLCGLLAVQHSTFSSRSFCKPSTTDACEPSHKSMKVYTFFNITHPWIREVLCTQHPRGRLGCTKRLEPRVLTSF